MTDASEDPRPKWAVERIPETGYVLFTIEGRSYSLDPQDVRMLAWGLVETLDGRIVGLVNRQP